ncbi:MAG: hypothetical protein JWM84_3750 [Nocardioides sp.]|nr:hypothetical protein [Nocardioides sp.]
MNFAELEATARSLHKTKERPAPAADPCTAVTTILSNRAQPPDHGVGHSSELGDEGSACGSCRHGTDVAAAADFSVAGEQDHANLWIIGPRLEGLEGCRCKG